MVKKGWLCCECCKRKLFPVEENTVIKNLHFMCKHCKQINKINMDCGTGGNIVR